MKRDNKGRFLAGQSGNPQGRKPEAEKVRELLEPRRDELVSQAVTLALQGDATALRLCLDRLAPPPKSESRSVEVPGLPEAGTLTAKADAIMGAVGRGEVPPDIGERLLAALGNYAKALELDELERRISALEQGGEHGDE